MGLDQPDRTRAGSREKLTNLVRREIEIACRIDGEVRRHPGR